jgi:CDP-3, 6-dideoxy-D-glycero-L-glycero-4-hexulose-4-reductase
MKWTGLKAYEILVSENKTAHKIYGVYTGNRISLKEMINLFQKVLQKPLDVNFGGKAYKKREIMIPAECYERFPNWKANVSLIGGLTFFNEWVKLTLSVSSCDQAA